MTYYELQDHDKIQAGDEWFNHFITRKRWEYCTNCVGYTMKEYRTYLARDNAYYADKWIVRRLIIATAKGNKLL